MATASGASGGGQGGLAAAAASQNPVASKNELSPVLQQLNLESIRTRAQDLFNAISRILHTFQTSPQHKWSEVLSQFSMVNIELLTFVEDIKPILKMFVVHPKNVNAESAQILPIMLSSKLLPEMEAEETSLKEQTLLGLPTLPIHAQTEKLQRHIEMVRVACEMAEKELAGGRKLYGLGSRQVPVITPPLDKAQAAKISEQEKVLRAAANYGEGLRLPPSERQHAASLPAHLVHALSAGEGEPLPYSLPGFPKAITSTVPSAVVTLSGASQQATPAQLLNRSTPSPLPMLGATSLDGTSASPMSYANSPRSGNTIMNEASPQQQQQQQTLLQRQKLQQLQKQQQMQQQQQQQLRQPAPPPITQSQIHQLQQQQHAHLQQHIQDRQQLQQLQLQQQQQVLHQQLQSNSLQPGQQLQPNIGPNQLTQSSQVKSHLGQLPSNPANSLFSTTQSSVLSSNMMANLSQTVQPQPLLQQRLNFGVGMQPQRNLASQILSDPMYNTGIGGSQNSSNLGLPLQQQLVGQSNFSNILNSNQNMNFGQQRQPPPSQ
eukprot:c28663_g1_i2 orf=228-1868(+)